MADDLDERLIKQLELVNDWLKYAEAKNGVLIGLASAGAAGALSVVGDVVEKGDHLAVVALILAEITLLAGLGFGLFSFLPKTNLKEWTARHRGRVAPTDNLYYYGDLAKYEATRVAEILSRRHVGRNASVAESTVELSEQLVINARITLWKLRLFQFGLSCFALGVALSTMAVMFATLV